MMITEVVDIYEKPILKEKLEGKAKIKSINRVETITVDNVNYLLADCRVIFEDDQKETYTRQIAEKQ